MSRMSLTPEELKAVAREMCKEEYESYLIYSYLASIEKDEENACKLREMAAQERRHYEFWKRLGECETPRISLTKAKLLAKVFGIQFLLKKMELSEKRAIECYKKLKEMIKDEGLRKELERILRDELEHEEELLREVEDPRVKYLGYVALGLADAVVEVTGVHAGFLGATANTVLAGLAGLIVGFSASLSMTGAAYVQAKHDPDVKAPLSAGITGISYLLSVVLLALPYFLIHDIWMAFAASLAIALAILGSFIYYSSVINEKPFSKEYMETVILLMTTAFGSYVFGNVMESLLGTHVFGH